MTSKLQFTATSTIAVLENQAQELREAVEQKQKQIERLRKVQESIAFQAGGVNAATSKIQEVLVKPVFQTPLEHHLQPSTEHPLKQWRELIDIASKIKQGEVASTMKREIEKLNQTIGRTEAHAENWEEELQKLNKTLEAFRKQVQQRREIVELTKQLTREL